MESGAHIVATSTAVLHRHGRSFWLASLLLPAAQRADAAVVYAFCRLVDDLADEAPDTETARRDLARVQAELALQAPARPLVTAFLEVCARCGIDRRAVDHLVRAVLTDLEPVRIEDDRGLLRYAYGVAGTVGLMMCGVLGVRAREALPHAVDLGVAMQLTNICRDVLEDARRGRVYLPASCLRQAGVDPEALVRGEVAGSALVPVVRDLLALAERHYASADAGMRYIPLVPRFAILVAARVYRAIGLRLLRVHGGDPLHGRTVVPWTGKLRWVAVALAQGLRPQVLGLVPSSRHDADLHTALDGFPGTGR